MALFSTGPIDNSPILGIRQTQIVTVKVVNRDSLNPYNLVIQGFFLNGSRTMYVNETVNLTPNQVLTRNYFADLDAFEFVFATLEEVEAQVGISVWGKQASGQLVDPHRVVAWEKHAEII
ncbi:hypothetical protein M2444_005062 [Paenibacillus sp. PastF-3]|uniref:hypothetical protein n=1 Tax=unclassified Paenibacillus TaxID=185978 RepID=UPI000BA0ED90|nr:MULTISPECIES: hypothetical protein [unclassified Paenibacillus]MDH6373232.1 hypothetical protein [Paenibacillus sp. PastF-3]OZQ78000.1 hypothetical protein CA598_29520 [Paenibacillus sp. VTT E-133291]